MLNARVRIQIYDIGGTGNYGGREGEEKSDAIVR